MSHGATSGAWGITGLSSTQKLVLLCLADHADRENRCWPSLACISRRTCLSERAVWQAVRDLEGRRLVRTETRGRNQSNVYTLDLAPAAIAPDASNAPPATAPDASNAPAAIGLRTSFQKDSHVVHAEVAPSANESVIEPVKEPVKRTVFAMASPQPSLPSEQPALLPDALPPQVARKTREPKPKADTAPSASALVWSAYAAAFKARYGTEPTRNARVNAQIAQFVGRVPADEAPQIAAFYLRHSAAFYAGQMHSVGLLLRDAEKLRAEWQRGQTVNMTEARRNEQTAANPWVRRLAQMDQEKKPESVECRVEDDDDDKGRK